MIGTMVIGAMRGIQWDRSHISVLVGSLYFFFVFTPVQLYSDLNNTTVSECTNFEHEKSCLFPFCVVCVLGVRVLSGFLHTRVFPVL